MHAPSSLRSRPSRRCDRLAEISALFHTGGTVHLLGRGAVSFHLDFAESAVARRAFAILRALRVEAEIRTYRRRAFDGAARTQLLVAGSDHAIDVLAQAGVVSREGLPLDRPPGHVVARPCCRSAYLRGAFLGAGRSAARGRRTSRCGRRSVRARPSSGASLPPRGSACASSTASRTRRPMRRVGTASRRTCRSRARPRPSSHSRSGRSSPGSGPTPIGWRTRITRTSSGRAARPSRSSRPSGRCATRASLEDLGATLQDAAHLRLRHPSLSLRELAARAEPPVTKAAMAGRLARLVAYAEDPRAVPEAG